MRRAVEGFCFAVVLLSTWAFIINPVVSFICDDLPAIQLNKGN